MKPLLTLISLSLLLLSCGPSEKKDMSYCDCLKWSVENPNLTLKDEDIWDNCKWMEEKFIGQNEEEAIKFHEEAMKDCPEIAEKLMSIAIEGAKEKISDLSEEEIEELIKDE